MFCDHLFKRFPHTDFPNLVGVTGKECSELSLRVFSWILKELLELSFQDLNLDISASMDCMINSYSFLFCILTISAKLAGRLHRGSALSPWHFFYPSVVKTSGHCTSPGGGSGWGSTLILKMLLCWHTEHSNWWSVEDTRLRCLFHPHADFAWNNLVYCAQTQQTHPAVQFENETNHKRHGERQGDRVDLLGFLLHENLVYQQSW